MRRVEGDAGTEGAVSFTTLEPTSAGTRIDYQMYYDSQDLDTTKAHLDEVFVDMADRLIGELHRVDRFAAPADVWTDPSGSLP